MAMDTIAPPPQASIDSSILTAFLSCQNTELKILALGSAQTEIPTAQSQLHRRIMIDASGGLFHSMDPSNFGDVLARMPDALILPGYDHQVKERTFTKSKHGELASALGGHLLRLSVASSVPVRVLVGEQSPNRRNFTKPEDSDYASSIETRLSVLAGLLTLARGEWVTSKTLYRELEASGVPMKTANKHLRTLRDAKIIEQNFRKQRQTRYAVYRIAEDDQYYNRIELVERYLGIAVSFARLEPDFLAQGLTDLETIRNDKTVVPYLIKRSHASTKHTGKTSQRTSN